MPLAILKQIADGSLEKQFDLHPGQAQTFRSEARYVLMIAGLQSGKTCFAPLWCAREIKAHPGGRGMVVGPIYDLLEREALRDYQDTFQGTEWEGHLDKSKRIYTHPDGTRVYFRSADNPEHLEAGHFDWAWLDEAGQYKYGVWLAIKARLSIGQGRILVTTTPYLMNWLYKEWYKKWKEGDERFDVINFASNANPVFPQEEFDEAERDLPPEIFQRRYMGLFTQMAGMVYPELSRCIIDRMALPQGWEKWEKIGGIDFGYHNPFVILNAVRSPDDVIYVYEEHCQSETLVAEHAKRLRGYTVYEADPEDPQEIAELEVLVRDAGLPDVVIHHAKNDIALGIQKVRERMRTGRWFVTRNCRHTIDEHEAYHYKDTEEQQGDEKPVKKDDHTCDANRYMVAGIDLVEHDEVWVL